MSNARVISEAEPRLVQAPEPGGFDQAELAGLPERARRHLRAAIAPGVPLVQTARLRMRGWIRLGRWLPFHAVQVLSPHRGFVWAARVGGVISGWDRYLGATGAMEWKLAGLLPVARAAGPDVARSAAGRLAAEAIWLPTALLPRCGVEWGADGSDRVCLRYQFEGIPLSGTYQLDGAGRIASLQFDRWGDPHNAGTWGWHRFGGEITRYSTFQGLTVPAAGRVGWFFGTDRWPEGEFFRFRITDLRPRTVG